MFYILISIIAGVIIVISRTLNTKLSENVGLIESGFFNYFTGLLTSIIVFIVFKERVSIGQFINLPLYAYLGGVLGVIVVILNSVITPKMSSFYATLIIFIGQLFTGIIVDCITIGSVSLPKIIGGILVVIGLAYNLYIDSSTEEVLLL